MNFQRLEMTGGGESSKEEVGREGEAVFHGMKYRGVDCDAVEACVLVEVDFPENWGVNAGIE